MFRRVEICFPITSKKLQNRIMHNLDLYLKDSMQAWLLQPDGSYLKLELSADEEPVAAQTLLLNEMQS
jgi:polyphosphate kinase